MNIRSNRRQQAIEKVCKNQHERGPRNKDYRFDTTLEDVQRKIKIYRNWQYNEEAIEKPLAYNYKNGTKLYKFAMELENSPLNQALL